MSKDSVTQHSLRSAAEAKLGNAPAPRILTAEALLHELQVHEIELEMQNDSLREAQTALEESRNRYLDLYEFAPIGYLTLSSNGLIDELNLTAAKLLGSERKKLLQKRFTSLVITKDQTRWTQLLLRTGRQDGKGNAELGLQRSDGTVFQVQLDCERAKVGSGATEIRMVLNDITKRKQMEISLLDSEERYRLLFETSKDAIFITNPEVGSTLAANPVACEMFGYNHEELCRLGRAGIMDASDPRLPDMVASRSRNGHVRSRVRCIKSNGDVFSVELASVVFRDSKNRPRAVVHIRDISEQLRAEKNLHESEMRWQFAVESHGDAMWDWDADKDELFLTAAARELFNLPDTDSKRPITDLLEQVLEEDRALVQGQIDDILAGKTSEWLNECRLSGFGHAPRWIATRGRVMTRGAEGQPQRIVSISRDITERKLSEAEGRRHRELIAQQGRLVLLGELASALAHEINQPLTAITGFAAACVRKTKAIPEAQELAHAIEDQAMRAGEIAWRIRGFARRQRLERAPLSLHEVIGGVAKWVRMDSNYSDAVINITGVDPALPPVIADRVELEQVLFNLVRNGIEAELPNAHEHRIRIAGFASKLPGEIEVSVTDWGHGLPADMDINTFSPFTSTKEEGLGLGLTICRSIIEGHGGHLWATPNPEGGTIFHFTLPVAKQVMQPAGLRIVLVEDDLMVATAMQMTLESSGMTVTRYKTAEEALADSAIADADFYISDLRLPGLSGVEFLDAVQRKATKPIRAALLTGDTAIDKIDMMRSTSWQVLFKPVALSSLLSAIQSQHSAH
jgi:PAS domain S-box-containing protein